MAENYFVKVLIPLKGVLKRIQLVWARKLSEKAPIQKNTFKAKW
jgi:hypothetical protein